MKNGLNGLHVAEHLLATGACTSLPPDSRAWHLLRVQCSRIFHESYQDLEQSFALAKAVSAEIHKQRDAAYQLGLASRSEKAG